MSLPNLSLLVFVFYCLIDFFVLIFSIFPVLDYFLYIFFKEVSFVVTYWLKSVWALPK